MAEESTSSPSQNVVQASGATLSSGGFAAGKHAPDPTDCLGQPQKEGHGSAAGQAIPESLAGQQQFGMLPSALADWSQIHAQS